MKTFLTSFLQVGCVAINTYFITQLNWVGIFIVSFIISLLWAFNVSKISVSTTNQKLTYALGAGCGAVIGLLIVTSILK
jgi:hypothetical protein